MYSSQSSIATGSPLDFVGIGRLLRDCIIDQTKIVFDLDSLRPFPGPKKTRDGDGSKQRNHRYHDHDFDQRKSGRCEGDSPPFAAVISRGFHYAYSTRSAALQGST
jgi:hypothetical protein